MRRLSWMIAPVLLLACYTRHSTLTPLPLATPLAAAAGRGDVAFTGQVPTYVGPQDQMRADNLWTPRVQLETTGTIRFARMFGLRPIFGIGLAQGAAREAGPAGPGLSSGMPTMFGGVGTLFRIEPEARLHIDIEIDAIAAAPVEIEEVCGAVACAPVREALHLVAMPQAAVTTRYIAHPMVGMHGGLALVTQPTTVNGDLAAVGVLRLGAEVMPLEWLDIELDVQWPFVGAPAIFAPAFVLTLRAHFGDFESVAPPEPLSPAPPPRIVAPAPETAAPAQ